MFRFASIVFANENDFHKTRDQDPPTITTSDDVDDIAAYVFKNKGVLWPPLLGSDEHHIFQVYLFFEIFAGRQPILVRRETKSVRQLQFSMMSMI